MNVATAFKRPLRIALPVLIVGLVTFAVVTLPPPEPRYQGKPLRYWLSRAHNQSLSRDERERTIAAVCTIGTNNLQLLLSWFREQEPPDSEPFYRKAVNWLLSRQRFSTYRLEHGYHPSRPAMAIWVFTDYPEVAEKAIPTFITLLAHKDDTVKGRAALVLGKIGPPVLPALVPVLSSTNDIVRALAAWIIGEVGTNASYLRPKLEVMLRDRVIFVRLNSAVSLSKLDGDPEQIVTVLLQCIHEGDQETRTYGLDILGKLRDRAKSAVPDLTNSLASATNATDRMSFLAALREIDPDQAAKFDPPPEPVN